MSYPVCMRHLMRIGLLSVTLVTPGAPLHTPDVGLPNLIIEIAIDSLNDVAQAHYTPWRGVILYNPLLQHRLGPELTAFFRAHEFGHLYHHHTRTATSGTGVLRDYEFTADCYAARQLHARQPRAVEAAIAFFERQGEATLDAAHPAGRDRARQLRKCAR